MFVALHEKGYIYRDRYMVNWDPGSRSAISDLEVEPRDVSDTLYYIDYPLASGGGSITVATVRPETMLADTAIAVHPDDERYRRLIGEKAILPLVGRKLKIIADEYVKPEFGTGALKITPAHDPNDFEIGRRHGLGQPQVIGEDGRMTDEAPERFVGMTVSEAQAAVVAELREQGLIARTEVYHHDVPFSQRSGERIEPLISLQWFMAMDELAKPAIDAVTSGRIRFFPENHTRVYLEWMRNIRPWCISRQLWWGHRLPVWYRGEQTHVGTEAPEGEGWTRDPDVLDTWFSSALWPFATLGWPEQTPELRAFYPTDALVTGRDIIFLWVARMIMMGLEFTGREPFTDVHITAIIQAPDGRRMSKSLGTGIDPLDLIEGGPRPPVFATGTEPAGEFAAYGADAVRWGLLAMSSGQDVKFSEEKIAQGQQLTNKLWNAARLILLGVGPDVRAAATPTTTEDRWILSRLARAKSEVSERIEGYDFSHAALALYEFVYGELCDWYLELVKPRLRGGGRSRARVDAPVRADRNGRARASADPVRDRGDLLAHPGFRRTAGRPPRPPGGADRRAFREADRRRDRGRPGAADVARHGRSQAGRARAGQAGRVRLRRDRRPRGAAGADHARRQTQRRRNRGDGRDPRRIDRGSRQRGARSRGRGATAGAAAGQA